MLLECRDYFFCLHAGMQTDSLAPRAVTRRGVTRLGEGEIVSIYTPSCSPVSQELPWMDTVCDYNLK